MNPIAAQQVALDNALVAPENRVQIGQCNIRIDPTKTQKEPTYQAVLDSLALSSLYSAFLITSGVPKIYIHQFWHTINKIKNSSSYKFKLDKKQCIIDVEVFCDILQICPRLPNQEFDTPPSDEEIATFIKELEHKVTLNLSLMWLLIKCTNHGELLLQSSTSVSLGKSLVLIRSDFQEHKYYRIDNKDHKKQENMYYPKSTKVIIHYFISKDKSITMRNKIFMHTVRDDSVLGTLRLVSKSDEYQVYGALLPEGMFNQQMRDSPAHKTYLAFTIGAATPKRARKFKKPSSSSSSSSKKKTLVVVQEPAEKPAKKPATRRQSTGVQIRDTPGVSVLKKKTPAKTERSKEIELLSDAALLEEAQLKKAIKQSRQETNIHQAGGSSEGAGLEPKVPDEPKGKSIDTSEGTGLKPGVLNVPKAVSSEIVDHNKTDDEEDEFIHTPDDYVPTDDENVDDEESKRINKEMYSDVNVELKDSERESEGKDDEEITDAGQVDVEHENVSQEVAGDQDKDDAQVTGTATLATQKIEVPLQSSSITFDYAAKFLNFDNIPSEATTSTTTATDSTTLTAIHQRLSDMENEVKILRNVDHSSAIRAAVKSEVPIFVKE
ncbi:hypothetical protein Tco_0779893 [Tanacetum coccineum]